MPVSSLARTASAGALAAILVPVTVTACDSHRPRFSPGQPVAPLVTAPTRAVTYRGGAAGQSIAADRQMVVVAASRSIAGSTDEERETAYDAWAAAAGTDTARSEHWFDREEDRHVIELPAFRIDLMPVSNAAYAEFVGDGGAAAPTMDAATWATQGFQQDWATEVERFVWQGDRPPSGREDHPVVLVTWDDAAAYCAWRGQAVDAPRRLPGAHEFEKAARGPSALAYPFGPEFDRAKLNAGDGGPGDTVAVGSFPDAASPFGVLDLAGNVFQWTATRWPPAARATEAGPSVEMTVKGSAWDDHAGLGRGAAWHGRPRTARHVIVGFRCAADRASD